MFTLFLPYVIGIIIGVGTPDEPEFKAEVLLPPLTQGSGDGAFLRGPEPQESTGKFLTATEIRPILEATRENWVALRTHDGQDYIYFSHLLAWRCGLWELRFGINENTASRVHTMEPCNTEADQPNTLADVINYPVFVVAPLNSVATVAVEITYDDGTTDFAEFNRDDIILE